MTILRSREVKSLVSPPSKNNSPNSKNTKQPRVSSIEPKTPGDTQAVNASHSSSMMDENSKSRSGSSSVRRSSRLASKHCDDSKKSEAVLSVSSELSRKRESVRGIEEERKVGGVELEGVVVRESDSSGVEEGVKVGGVELEDVVVEDSMGSEKGSGEVLKKGQGELEDVVVEDSVGSGKEGGSGEVSRKRKGKRKLGFGNVGEGEGDGGCLRLRSGKKVAGRGGVRGVVENVEVLGRDARGGDYGGMEIGGRGDLKSSFDEVEEGKVEGLREVEEGLMVEAVSVDDEGEGRVSGMEKGKGKVVDINGRNTNTSKAITENS